jgi:hypothetical protein
MRQKRKLKTMYYPPDGFMWFGPKARLWKISDVELSSKQRMNLFDKEKPFRMGYYRNDPSYYWAEKVKAKRNAKGKLTLD